MTFKTIFRTPIKYSLYNLKTAECIRIQIAKSLLISRSLTTSDTNVVLHEIVNNKGILTLNRPSKLNSINPTVTETALRKLLEWQDKVEMVIIRGEGKAFCTGGDILDMTKSGLQNVDKNKEWFKSQYTLNGVIHQYSVPYVALMDGLTIGGGISMAYDHIRIATERTVAATPETIIGFFNDGSHVHMLSRMPHRLGYHLGLTGHRLKGTDVVKAGIATHYIKSENIPTILKRLIELNEPTKNLDELLLRHTEDISRAEFSLNPHLGLIEKTFSASSVEEIFENLKCDGSDFAKKTLEQLKKMSPTSLKISRKLMNQELNQNLSCLDCLMYCNRVASAIIENNSSDFYEGVRAMMLDKDNSPKWNPATLEGVTDEMVEQLFEEILPEEELNFKENVKELRNKLQA